MANELMSHKEWMKLTYGGATSIRSGKLKAVDGALERYHRTPDAAHLDALNKAFTAWLTDKGADWKSSVRNAHNAVETLRKQLLGQALGPAAGSEGLALMEAEAHQVMQKIFVGARIAWKIEFGRVLRTHASGPGVEAFADAVAEQYKASAANNKYGLAGNSAGLASASSTLHTVRTTGSAGGNSELIGRLVAQVVPASAQREVLGAVQLLIPSFQAQFAAAVVPLAGVLMAAGTTFWNTGNALVKHYGVTQSRMHRDRSLAGVEGRHAIEAMIRILERERNADIYAAGVSAAELGGKIAGLAIDGGMASGAAVGAAANIAKLLNIIHMIYRDVSEKNAANRLLAANQVDLDVFEVCPLLGCYLVCCLPTSALMSLILKRFGQTGWMDVAERTVTRHILPLREKARGVIQQHRFEIKSLRRFPGVLSVNQEAIDMMIARVGHSRYGGGGAGAFPDRVAS